MGVGEGMGSRDLREWGRKRRIWERKWREQTRRRGWEGAVMSRKVEGGVIGVGRGKGKREVEEMGWEEEVT